MEEHVKSVRECPCVYGREFSRKLTKKKAGPTWPSCFVKIFVNPLVGIALKLQEATSTGDNGTKNG